MHYVRISVLFLLLLLTGCEELSIKSHWALQSPMIDGKLDDWNPETSVKIDKDITVNVSNDRQFLHFYVLFDEQTRMPSPGNLTIWLDPAGEQNKEWTIYFPATNHADFNQRRGGFWQSMTVKQVERMSDSLNVLRNGVLVANRNLGFRKLYLPNEVGGFAVASAREGETFAVEATIPLTFDPSFARLTAPESDHKLAVGVLPGGRPRLDTRMQDTSFEPMRPVQGGLDQPATRQQVPGRREFKKPEELWMEVILAYEE